MSAYQRMNRGHRNMNWNGPRFQGQMSYQQSQPRLQNQKFLKNWERLTKDNFILECVSGCEIPILKTLNQLDPPLEPVWSKDSFDKIKVAVSRLLSIGAVQTCLEPRQFLSKYFLVNKPDGSKRFILNLKELNNFTYSENFRLEDLRTAIRLLQCNSFMCNLDLKDAYLLVPVNVESRKFLRFVFYGKLYQFTTLPFDLCTSPHVFTKILKPVIPHLRSEGFLSTICLDDIVCVGRDHKVCLLNVTQTMRVLESLGFIINYKKSNLIPSMRVRFLGFVLNSISMTVELPLEKRRSLITMIDKFLITIFCKIGDFAQLSGSLVAACPGIEYGKLYCWSLERERFFPCCSQTMIMTTRLLFR